MIELLLIDQFLTSLHSEPLRTKLCEKKLSTVQAVATQADEYLLNRRMEESFPSACKHPSTPQFKTPDNSSHAHSKADGGSVNTAKPQSSKS